MKKRVLLFNLTALSLVCSPTSRAALAVPTGLNPGDKYHIIFVSSTTRDATSSNIADYDAHVQSAANATDIGTTIGVDWLALGSRPTVNAYDQLAPVFSDVNTVPIYNQNGELVATSLSTLFPGSGGIYPHGPAFDEYGRLLNTLSWTGTFPTGVGYTDFQLGTATSTFAIYGGQAIAGTTNTIWITNAGGNKTELLSIYGVSEELVVPEPSSLALLGLGGLLICRRRRS